MKAKEPVIKAEESPSEEDLITKGLLDFDPTNPDKPVIPTPEVTVPVRSPQVSPTKPAAQVLKEFLELNKIELTVSTLTEGIKTVSDGSIILSNPKIIVNYKN
jgi:hypothetical protein